MALTARQNLEVLNGAFEVPGKLAASDTFYKGGIMVYDADGYLAATGGGIPAGILTGYGFDAGEDSQVVGAAEHPDAEVVVGKVWVPFSGAAQSDVGEMFYVTDDGTVTQTAGSNTVGLMCRAFKTGFVLLDFASLMTVDTTA